MVPIFLPAQIGLLGSKHMWHVAIICVLLAACVTDIALVAWAARSGDEVATSVPEC